MPPRIAKLIKKNKFTDDVIEIFFETPDVFNFQAGQFIKDLNLPKIELPQVPELPDLNNIETNAQEETQIQEN